MNLLIGVTTLALLALGGCSSTKKDRPAQIVEEVIKTETPTYVVIESSNKTRPAWIEEPTLGDDTKNVKDSRYFINRSEHSNRRLCEQSAETRATASIAKEIAQFMKNSYTEATQDQGEDEATEYMEESLARDSQTFIVGAQVKKSFWEKRKYKEELGADENKTEFVCYALVKMPKKEILKAVKSSRQKLIDNIKTAEVKAQAQKALKDVEKKFSELDKPVLLENSEE